MSVNEQNSPSLEDVVIEKKPISNWLKWLIATTALIIAFATHLQTHGALFKLADDDHVIIIRRVPWAKKLGLEPVRLSARGSFRVPFVERFSSYQYENRTTSVAVTAGNLQSLEIPRQVVNVKWSLQTDRLLHPQLASPKVLEGLEDCVVHLTQIHAHDALGQSDVDSDESQINRIFDEGLRRSLHDFGINLDDASVLSTKVPKALLTAQINLVEKQRELAQLTKTKSELITARAETLKRIKTTAEETLAAQLSIHGETLAQLQKTVDNQRIQIMQSITYGKIKAETDREILRMRAQDLEQSHQGRAQQYRQFIESLGKRHGHLNRFTQEVLHNTMTENLLEGVQPRKGQPQ